MKTIAEQIQDLQNTRAAKAARAHEIVQKGLAEGRSTDDDEAAEFDELDTEVKRLDADLHRLKRMESIAIGGAKGVDGSGTGGAASSRSGTSNGHVFSKPTDVAEKFKGQNFVRQVIAKAAARLEDFDGMTPARIAESRWGKSSPTLVAIMKANEVAGGGTGASEWGHELVTANNRYTGDFIEFLYGMTVFDKLPLRAVPQNVMIKGQDGASTAYWVGESKAIPATTADFFDVSLTPLKVAALAVISNELIRDSSPDAEMLVRDSLAEASAQRVDTTFLSSAAGVSGVSPAGLLNGVTGIATAGNDADGLRADIKALYAAFIAAKNASNLWMAANPSLAKSISLMTNALGQTEFEMAGDRLLGDRIVLGDNVDASRLILIKPTDVYRIGDLGVQVSISKDAMIEQSTVPTGATDTPVAASQAFTSMFQSESTAIKIVRPINFAKRRASAVTFITGANYGAPAV